mmetsp:Transcript_31748/g.53554  ORF Transcript_31748/g.53554 Transcript_31748/m.53554 type:complete len:136 (-) Transcript_31748:145-552(-)
MFARLTQFSAHRVTNINSQLANLQAVRNATKKAGGSTRNGRDSPGQRLGVKKFGGEYVTPGNIIIRQRGRKYHEGTNTKIGRDHTIYSVMEGYVKFTWNRLKKRQIVSVTLENPNIPRTKRPVVVNASNTSVAAQ